MDPLDTQMSSESMNSLELDALHWMNNLIIEEKFNERPEYQQTFLRRQYDKIYNKIQKRFK